MITMEEMYQVKNKFFEGKEHRYGIYVSWEEENPNVLQYSYIGNSHIHEETLHETLTQQLNESVGEVTPCLVTEFRNRHLPTGEKNYSVYFHSLSNREGINECSFILGVQRNSFSRFTNYVFLPDGERETQWESVDLYFFQNRLIPLIEDMLLHLPEYRLRYVTGELRKR